ncbi:MAG: phytanoyl-CoA dioxygenase [Verrucomicrobia bacterium]|nr:phytanoyl-CoA dioxygenase [Verrucomicrobiota bacterium]
MIGATMNDEYPLSIQQVTAYQRDGYIQLDNVITGDELTAFRTAVNDAVKKDTANVDPNRQKNSYEQIFIQCVNLWHRYPDVKPFVLSHKLGRIAAQLSGLSVRLWHDHALFKEPHTGAKTPWHQDTPYWPHQQKMHQLTIWIALQDTTIHNGCMSFIPGTQKMLDIEPVNLANPQDLHAVAPQTKGIKPVTCPLTAGSCTVHNGMTFHYAGPNRSDGMREAIAIIYMPDGTTYHKVSHPVTDPLALPEGHKLDTEMFPLVAN